MNSCFFDPWQPGSWKKNIWILKSWLAMSSLVFRIRQVNLDTSGCHRFMGFKRAEYHEGADKGKMMHLLSRMDMYTLLILESSFRIAVWWHVSFSQISTNATCLDFWATPWGPSSFQVDSNLVSFKLRNRVLQEDDTYESLRMAPQVMMIRGNKMRQLDNQSLILLFP